MRVALFLVTLLLTTPAMAQYRPYQYQPVSPYSGPAVAPHYYTPQPSPDLSGAFQRSLDDVHNAGRKGGVTCRPLPGGGVDCTPN